MIAVYDDDQCMVDLVKIILDDHHLGDVQAFTVESEVLAALESGQIDLIITDMTGHNEVLNRIRMLGVVHITMSGDQNNKPDLQKPFELVELIKLVKERLCSA